MLKINNRFFGFALAMGISLLTYGLLWVLNDIILFNIYKKYIIELQFIMILSLAANFFPLKYYSDRLAQKTAQGMMFFVLIGAGYIIFRFFWDEVKF